MATLNGAGRAFARSLIADGKVDKTASWSFSAEDGDKLLGPGGDDWANFGKHHLGINPDGAEKTKDRYRYPVAKAGTLYRAGLTAAKQRAGQQNDTAIEDAAGALIDEIDGEQDRAAMRPTAGYGMKAAASGSNAEIFLYDIIGSGWMGGIGAEQFAGDLRALGSVRTIDLRINSDGGDVFEGRTIYTLLNEHPANIVVHVDGLAASIASLIAMAGDEIRMADGAMMMIHNAWGLAIGNSVDMRKQADLLDMVDQGLVKTYCARTKMAPAACAAMMAAETWMSSDDAVKNGFADSTSAPMQVAARVRDLVAREDGRIVPITQRFRNVPANLRPRRAAAAADTAALRQLMTPGR